MFPWHQYILGLILISTGFLHFKLPKKWERILPDFIPAHSSMVLLFGIFEMIAGLMLITAESQNIAAWGIIMLMVIYLVIPFYWMLKKEGFVLSQMVLADMHTHSIWDRKLGLYIYLK